jgi:hypothetical protein
VLSDRLRGLRQRRGRELAFYDALLERGTQHAELL